MYFFLHFRSFFYGFEAVLDISCNISLPFSFPHQQKKCSFPLPSHTKKTRNFLAISFPNCKNYFPLIPDLHSIQNWPPLNVSKCWNLIPPALYRGYQVPAQVEGVTCSTKGKIFLSVRHSKWKWGIKFQHLENFREIGYQI